MEKTDDSKASPFSLQDWANWLIAYRGSLEPRVLHATNLLFVLVGLVGGLLLWVLSFGLSTLALFFLLSVIPLAVFFVLLYQGKRNRVFWMVESGLFTLGLVGFVLGLLFSGRGSGGQADDTGLMFIGSYFVFLLLVATVMWFSSSLLRSHVILHNLDRLAVAVATGWIADQQTVSRRFEKIMRPWWTAETSQLAKSGRLLGFRNLREFDDYRDEVVYQWVIETYGEVSFPKWVIEHEERLRKFFGNRLKTIRSGSDENCEGRRSDRNDHS